MEVTAARTAVEPEHQESDATKALYGIDDEVASKSYGETLLRARRLAERGVRFIQVVSGDDPAIARRKRASWDAPQQHAESNHRALIARAGRQADRRPARRSRSRAACLTPPWWSGPPSSAAPPFGQSGNGRDHNPWGYTQWLAGGGLKAGFTHGETDEIGLQTADKDKAVDTYDLQATVLHLLGLDHLKTTFLNNGRSERPTVVYGKVVKEILST